jgi:hypothetical protein
VAGRVTWAASTAKSKPRAYDRKTVGRLGEFAWLDFPEQHNGPPERKKTVGT